jgi:hypothetical protein
VFATTSTHSILFLQQEQSNFSAQYKASINIRTSPSVSLLWLLPRDMLERALKILQIDTNWKSRQWQTEQFHAHFGSDPLDLANIWYDLSTTDIEDVKLMAKEKSENGLKCFLVAQHF